MFRACISTPKHQELRQGAKLTLLCFVPAKLEIHGLQHIGFLIESLERSMEFYRGVLGRAAPQRHSTARKCSCLPLLIYDQTSSFRRCDS